MPNKQYMIARLGKYILNCPVLEKLILASTRGIGFPEAIDIIKAKAKIPNKNPDAKIIFTNNCVSILYRTRTK